MTRKFMKSSHILVCSIFILSSCSSTYRPSESFDAKVERYQAQTYTKNPTPELPQLNKDLLSLRTNTRAPASVKNEREGSDKSQRSQFIQTQSPKRLYFLALYTQFQKLSKIKSAHGAKAPEVCPHFHSSLVEHRERFSSFVPKASSTKKYPVSLLKEIKKAPEKIAFHPELALPIDAQSLTPKVIDLIDPDSEVYNEWTTQALIDKAISVHLNKTQSELSELCEFGSSDNLYIYQNMASKNNKEVIFGANSMGLNTLLKTTLVFNQALIKSLESNKQEVSRAPASNETGLIDYQELYHKEVLKRLEADWMNRYFSELD